MSLNLLAPKVRKILDKAVDKFRKGNGPIDAQSLKDSLAVLFSNFGLPAPDITEDDLKNITEQKEFWNRLKPVIADNLRAPIQRALDAWWGANKGNGTKQGRAAAGGNGADQTVLVALFLLLWQAFTGGSFLGEPRQVPDPNDDFDFMSQGTEGGVSIYFLPTFVMMICLLAAAAMQKGGGRSRRRRQGSPPLGTRTRRRRRRTRRRTRRRK